ncbi:hypothetical protein NDU88_001679 [Pleurodeles waltl]|uniref:Uncharacterized protein n=1 Tax=Pleurodeles waltl TaxID=8319 RepID=A0AAV7U747_PLEWA|nr:hypothetical protein NDU88_001679 [Pleurodeles waltl]
MQLPKVALVRQHAHRCEYSSEQGGAGVPLCSLPKLTSGTRGVSWWPPDSGTSKIRSSGVPAAARERRRPGNQTAPEAGTALQLRPPSEQHTDPGRRGPTGAAGAASGGATPSGAPERGAQRATTHTVRSAENGRLRDRRALWFSGPDTESPNAGALTQAVRPQKVGGIEGCALEIRAL